ncbi:DUF1802 family protein [Candidatus Methylacidiphilum infernorum]|uniref:Uncharacterized conserved protein n=1 Tax=Methylacidiphilum infernorum (isolate V4) TaxID=481448 RepID=B3DZT9_METI4|nr:DUF1802 family protein [Candidatus Methylacidiphilum infernorum]ACD84274.1 Uncharacterized conserved protein [Methylacidiphilum infernorum V4]
MSESFPTEQAEDFLNSLEQYAFKDWQIVVEALGKGKQSILLRKGGIQEKEFQLKSPFFWLLPTHYHEELHQVKPEYRFVEKDEGEESSPGCLLLKYVAWVQEDFFVTDWEIVRRLSPFYIWEEPILKKRFDYGKKKGLSVLILRVYRAYPPLEVKEDEKAMRGCRSWVKMASPFTPRRFEAVIDEKKFCEIRKNILLRIKGLL